MIFRSIEAGLNSNVGCKRKNNQDNALASRGVYVVCDGMGGGKGGERASAQVAAIPSSEPSHAASPRLFMPPTSRMVAPVMAVVTPSPSSMGSTSRSRAGTSAFQIIKAEKTKESSALSPVAPANTSSNRANMPKATAWVCSR